jgi:creatinine amidohydrolase/Fe(II)-dependent formamide hydrolase-like protein
MSSGSVKYLELRPAEFKKRLQEKALAYLPLGTLEWHGEHLPLGADAIQSEAPMIEAARRFGGIVLPPIFLAPTGAPKQQIRNFWWAWIPRCPPNHISS